MGEKRRDNKGRILRNGESQRSDGRYAYVYVDNNGKQKFIYSWKLEKTDKIPQGKRDCLALRDKIKKVNNDNSDGIINQKLTVLKLVEKYTRQKTGVKHKTEYNYQAVITILRNDDFGKKLINNIKLSDAKDWFIELQQNGKSYNSICSIRGVLKPAFQMAVDDDLIRKNPFNFRMTGIVNNDQKVRQALTDIQEKQYLDFIKTDKNYSKYYEAIYILFNTGLRISEFAGLTKYDIDFTNNKIMVNHQLHKKKSMDYVVQTTKTSSGTREIPMSKEVCECFKTILQNRKIPKIEPMIDGKVGFLYLDKNGMPMVDKNWEKCFRGINKKYQKVNKTLFPTVTPHVCRHTFCSKMAKRGMNPKMLQSIMGHSNISLTLNVYTHVGFEDLQKEIDKVLEM